MSAQRSGMSVQLWQNVVSALSQIQSLSDSSV